MDSLLGCVSNCADCLPDSPCTELLNLGGVLQRDSSSGGVDGRTRWTQEREAEYRGHVQTDAGARERHVAHHHVAASSLGMSRSPGQVCDDGGWSAPLSRSVLRKMHPHEYLSQETTQHDVRIITTTCIAVNNLGLRYLVSYIHGDSIKTLLVVYPVPFV